MKKIKDFATPKRAIVTSVCLVGGLGALTAGSVAVTASVAKNNSIGNIAAEDIALKDAGIDYSQARIHRTEFDFDNGQFCMMWNFHPTGLSMIIGSRRLTVRFFGGTASRWTVMRQT